MSTDTVAWKMRIEQKPDEIRNRTNAFIEAIKNCSINAELEHPVDYNQELPSTLINDPLPVICIINGVGASGKGTFCGMVDRFSDNGAVEISTIDPVREAAKLLLENSVDFPMKYRWDVRMSSDDIVTEKGDAYRQFLHEIKDAWDRYDRSSLNYAISKVLSIIDERLALTVDATIEYYGTEYESMYTNKSLTDTINWIREKLLMETSRYYYENVDSIRERFEETVNVDTEDLPDVIFVNIREKSNIEAFRSECLKVGLLCFTLLVDGRHENELHNDADSHVHDMKYDLVIENTSDLDNLSTLAFMFTKFINRANKQYGISAYDMVETVFTKLYFDRMYNPLF